MNKRKVSKLSTQQILRAKLFEFQFHNRNNFKLAKIYNSFGAPAKWTEKVSQRLSFQLGLVKIFNFPFEERKGFDWMIKGVVADDKTRL